MKKKLIALVLSAVCGASLLAGCAAGTAQSAAPAQAEGSKESVEAAAPSEEPYKAVMVYVVASDSPDAAKVEEKFNELTKEQLNMEVDLMPMTFGTWISQMPLMLAGNEQVDVFPMWSSSAATYVSSDYVVDLKPYLDTCASYMVEQIGKDAIESCNINGFVYGIPSQKERSMPCCIVMRTDLLEETGIDPSTIKDFADLTPVFEAVKAAHPDMVVFGGSSTATPANQDMEKDGLGDGYGVLMDYGQSTTVENYYESDRFRELVELAREWYQAGYVSADMPTTTDNGELLMKGGNLFSYVSFSKPNAKEQFDDATGYDTTVIEMNKNFVNSTSYNAISFAVGSGSPDPEKAVTLLNWIASTKEANDLLNWGIEGVHWVETEDGTADYPEGVTAESCGYHQNMGYIMPNQFNSHVWKGNSQDVWERYEAATAESIKSKALGFVPDLTAYSDQLAALSEVSTQYIAQLTTGSVDPERGIEDFNNALYQAGLQEIMDAKQEQLDAWLAENGN